MSLYRLTIHIPACWLKTTGRCLSSAYQGYGSCARGSVGSSGSPPPGTAMAGTMSAVWCMLDLRCWVLVSC